MKTLRHKPRFMLVGLVDPFSRKEEILSSFEELESLVHTYGGNVFAASYQNNTRGDTGTYIGQGKAEELTSEILTEKIDIVVVNDSIKPRQLYNLQQIFIKANPNIKVWDRVDLILAIFEKHASTAEATLQIKLAAMNHMGPRIYGMGMVLSQQGGGIGTKGIGETNVELMQRHWKKEMSQVRKQLETISKSRTQQMENRKRNDMPTVSIVGYTNAGKTSLFNRLCHKDHVVKNELFVTLDSSVGSLYLPTLKRETFITDTIGFIQNLPTQLIDAFRSTLIETINADMILHVIDSTDPHVSEKILVVESILKELAAGAKPIIYVFNKLDLVDTSKTEEFASRYSHFHPLSISTKTGEGVENLIHAVEDLLSV